MDFGILTMVPTWVASSPKKVPLHTKERERNKGEEKKKVLFIKKNTWLNLSLVVLSGKANM
jgi:hypothetical protein